MGIHARILGLIPTAGEGHENKRKHKNYSNDAVNTGRLYAGQLYRAGERMNYAELSRRAEEYQMKDKITIKTVIEALEHASDKQIGDLLYHLDGGVNSFAGHELGDIIQEHIQSMEADIASEEQDDKAYLPARNRA